MQHLRHSRVTGGSLLLATLFSLLLPLAAQADEGATADSSSAVTAPGNFNTQSVARDAVVNAVLQRAVTPDNLCTTEALSALAMTPDECLHRVQQVHILCPERLAAKFPSMVSQQDMAELYSQTSLCYVDVMSVKDS